ncbi:MAG: peptidase [Schlesneria sp.]|nr:peptidase [Schlesneria sp.]
MFGTEPTPFDVRLQAFRIPIRVHPSFWIVAAVLRWDPDRLDIVFLSAMCLFVSILIHELGHALTAEAFGWQSEIILYWGGGLAISQRYHNRTPWREIAVSLAGPFAGFGLYALTRLTMRLLPAHLITERVAIVIAIMLFLNLWWGLVNLLPVLPLDGGQVCRSFLTWCRLRDPDHATATIGVVVAGLAAAFFFTQSHNNFAGMMFAMFCIQNLAMLQSGRRW